MPTKNKLKKADTQEADGYESDIDQIKNLKSFKTKFQTRLETAAKYRVGRSAQRFP